MNTVSRHATNPSPAPRHGTAESAAAMIEQLIDRLLLRALQFTLGGVLLAIAFLPLRERGSALELATAAILLSLTNSALVWRHPLLGLLRRRPATTFLFPVPVLLAVTIDGGRESVWTPLVAITVAVPATLGLPWRFPRLRAIRRDGTGDSRLAAPYRRISHRRRSPHHSHVTRRSRRA